jgi:hypothetical protein
MKAGRMAEKLKEKVIRKRERGNGRPRSNVAAPKDVKPHAIRGSHANPGSDESAILDRAIEVSGDRGEAMRWMGTPVRALGYATPISLLHNVRGRKSVIAVLTQLEHGVM